jgi:mono/diheme cytochrome c family protein
MQRDLQVPPGLDDLAKIPMGVEHFAAHCAVCHGAPCVPKGDIAHGLYPPPPDLAVTAKLYSGGETFWIIKHGIKMTGMPAGADHSDEEVWATVAESELSYSDNGRVIEHRQTRRRHTIPNCTRTCPKNLTPPSRSPR